MSVDLRALRKERKPPQPLVRPTEVHQLDLTGLPSAASNLDQTLEQVIQELRDAPIEISSDSEPEEVSSEPYQRVKKARKNASLMKVRPMEAHKAYYRQTHPYSADTRLQEQKKAAAIFKKLPKTLKDAPPLPETIPPDPDYWRQDPETASWIPLTQDYFRQLASLAVRQSVYEELGVSIEPAKPKRKAQKKIQQVLLRRRPLRDTSSAKHIFLLPATLPDSEEISGSEAVFMSDLFD